MVVEEIDILPLEVSEEKQERIKTPPSPTSETSMFTRPVRVTLARCIRHLHYGPATVLRVPLKIPGDQLQRRCYATPPPQVSHRWVSNTFTLKNIPCGFLIY